MSEQSTVNVAVRVRPTNKREEQHETVVMANRNTITLINLEDRKRKPFDFNYVFDDTSTQKDVYDTIGTQIVSNAYSGYNTCLFAYGQTGSGKTYAMLGGKGEDEGIIPRLCAELFKRQTDPDTSYKVELSYMEIYSEQVRDLISASHHDKKALAIRQHPELGPYVEGLTQIIVEDYTNIKKIIEKGAQQRMTAATLMNDRSSRSHAILTLYFTQTTHAASGSKKVKTKELVSKINLVDLAGSERVEMSGVSGINMKEAIDINKSLSNLGLVIAKLSTRVMDEFKTKKKAITKKSIMKAATSSEHIPFRDSALTWILKESLGGNSKTYMLATVSPSAINYNETLSTLRYAYNATKIINCVKVNEEASDKIVKMLKDEIEELKHQLRNQAGSVNQIEIARYKEEIAQREELIRMKEMTMEQRLEESHKIQEELERQHKTEIQQKEEQMHELKRRYEEDLNQRQEELAQLKATTSDAEVQLQQEYEKRQESFEKSRIVGTAIELQAYYEKRLETAREEIEAACAEKLKVAKDEMEADNIEKIKTIRTELETAHSEKIKTIRTELETAYAEKIKVLKDNLELTYETKIHAVQADLYKASATTTEQEQQYRAAILKIAEYEKELIGKNYELESAKAALATTTRDLSDTKAALATTTRDLDSTKAALATTTRDLSDTKAALATTTRDLDSTKAALATTTRDLDSTKAALATTTRDLDSTKAALATTERTESAAESACIKEIATLKQELVECQRVYAEAKTEADKLRLTIRGLNDKHLQDRLQLAKQIQQLSAGGNH
jgi:hypothetical protein